MSVWGPADAKRVEQRLRDLVDVGMSLEEAVRVVHCDDGLGALLISPAVEVVGSLSARDAKRLVVRVLYPIWHG